MDVIDALRECSVPEIILQCTLVREFHTVDSDAVDPNCTRTELCRLSAVTVMSPEKECPGALLGDRVLTRAGLYDNVSVKLPDCPPVVTAVRSVPYDPCTPRQCSEVSLAHSVPSAAVPWILDSKVIWKVPRPDPCTVIIVDPVMGMFIVMFIVANFTSTTSIDNVSVRVPNLVPTVARVRVDVWTPRVDIHRRPVSDSHSVPSIAVMVCLAICVKAPTPKPLPYTVIEMDPVLP